MTPSDDQPVPRDAREPHAVSIADGWWRCSCGAAGTGQSAVGLVRAAAAHEAKPEEPRDA